MYYVHRKKWWTNNSNMIICVFLGNFLLENWQFIPSFEQFELIIAKPGALSIATAVPIVAPSRQAWYSISTSPPSAKAFSAPKATTATNGLDPHKAVTSPLMKWRADTEATGTSFAIRCPKNPWGVREARTIIASNGWNAVLAMQSRSDKLGNKECRASICGRCIPKAAATAARCDCHASWRTASALASLSDQSRRWLDPRRAWYHCRSLNA